MFNLFVLWLCKNDKRMLFEQDGYKTFGEKLWWFLVADLLPYEP